MKQLIYVMQFKGKVAPANESGTVLNADTTAPGCAITSVVGPHGISGTLQPVGDAEAKFQSEVTFTREASFRESGTISFGENRHRLHFSTVGQGYIGASADPQLKHGSVIWRIDRGEGQFDGATGLITSNFFVSDTGEVTDNHFGVIFLKDE
ncbi:MAG: hypothetical protein HYY23_00105 [Verrucomicrobia bacterium]|nr:hypothetical protein [Verrucomicrobiota bacterium]